MFSLSTLFIYAAGVCNVNAEYGSPDIAAPGTTNNLVQTGKLISALVFIHAALPISF